MELNNYFSRLLTPACSKSISRFLRTVPLSRRSGEKHDKQLFLHVSAHVGDFTAQSGYIETSCNSKQIMECVIKINAGRKDVCGVSFCARKRRVHALLNALR